MVEDYEVDRGEKLKLDKEQIFLIIWKQGQDFKPLGSSAKSKEKKIKNVKKPKRGSPQLAFFHLRKKSRANNYW